LTSTTDLAKDRISKLFFNYYIQGLIGMLSMISHTLINGIILGRTLGKEALAAMAIFAPVNLIFMASVLVLMMGGGILFSKNKGAGDALSALKVFQFTTTLTLLLGAFAVLIALTCHDILTKILIENESIKITKYTSQLLFWNLLFMPFLLLRVVWGSFLVNDGVPNIAKNASLITACFNIFLDILLVRIFPFGIAGACIATAISMVWGLMYIFNYLQKGLGIINFKHFTLRLRLAEWRDFIKAGLPLFISEVSFSAGLLLTNNSLMAYGPSALSAFGIINFFNNIFLRFFITAMITAQPIMAFNIGAKQSSRVVETLKFGLLFTVVLGLIFYSASSVFSRELIEFVSGDSSLSFKSESQKALILSFLLYILAGPNYLLAMYMQVIGKSSVAIIINASKGFVLLALLLFMLPQIFVSSLDGIWISRPVAELATFILGGCFVLYKKDYYFKTAE
jgi:Na+-driven multidrug efflux pump